MKRCTAAILLMLSLGFLFAGRLSAAVADDGMDTIRLPSHGLADESATAARESGDEKRRPWGKCCDHTFCNRRMPPGCRCMDPVERCDDACSRCEVHPSDTSKHICMDRYTGDPGPNCTETGNDVAVHFPGGTVFPVCRWPCVSHDIRNGPGIPDHEATTGAAATTEAVSEKTIAAGEEEEARPWKCCDDTLCTRSAPPTCQCRDKVKKCAKACKHCEKADEPNGASSLYVCRDLYFGWSPNCSKGVAGGVRRGN